VFTEIIGADNPLNGFDVDTESDPSFADMDGDGDLDMISGENDGIFNYYKTSEHPLILYLQKCHQETIP
jgi:hypothetical protein